MFEGDGFGLEAELGGYRDAHITGIPDPSPDPPYNILKGEWQAWCCDRTHGVGDGFVQLYSSYAGDVPQPGDWSRANYLINTYACGTPYAVGDDLPDPPAGPGGKVTTYNLQLALWNYVNGGSTYGDNDQTDYMIDDAEANGENFVPMPGQYVCVILWPVNADGTYRDDQVFFVPVDP
jgi:hypothetical protein